MSVEHMQGDRMTHKLNWLHELAIGYITFDCVKSRSGENECSMLSDICLHACQRKAPDRALYARQCDTKSIDSRAIL
jgi:hypothetical protein